MLCNPCFKKGKNRGSKMSKGHIQKKREEMKDRNRDG